jgi:hypothetical protein
MAARSALRGIRNRTEAIKTLKKITESTMVSLDGVIGDPQNWAMQNFDDDAQQDALKRLLISDSMLMGRSITC